MKRSKSTGTLRIAFGISLIMTLIYGNALAQEKPHAQSKNARKATSQKKTTDHFASVEKAIATGESYSIRFQPTDLDKRAEAKAEAALRGGTLFVRVHAKNMPLPSHFNVPRYALWVYVPNYQVKMYIGDLPITPTSKQTGDVVRGESDAAYVFPALPPGATFGGLALTAEPVRFVPIINDALRPVLVGLLPREKATELIAATTIYSGTVPANRKAK